MTDEVQEMQRRWGKTIVSKDIDALLKLYAENAVLKPTLSPHIYRSRQEIRNYFEGDTGFFNHDFKEVKFYKILPLIVENVIISVGKYTFIKKDIFNLSNQIFFRYQYSFLFLFSFLQYRV